MKTTQSMSCSGKGIGLASAGLSSSFPLCYHRLGFLDILSTGHSQTAWPFPIYALQQLWQYLGFGRFGINSGFDTKFCGLGAHNFLLFVTSFAYCFLEIDRIYSSPEVKHAHVGLARPGTRALKLSQKQMEFRGFHLGIFRWKLCQSRCTKALN